jgi:hypothetical protein
MCVSLGRGSLPAGRVQECSNNGALPVDELRGALRYDAESGLFFWARHISKKCRSGAPAGAVTDQGYVRIRLRGKMFKAHRLAWLLTYGEWPYGPIDHINGIRDDNRLVNLRLANREINAQNLRLGSRANKTGYLGVTAVGSRFYATIQKGCAIKHLGRFGTPEEAHAAYVKAKREWHPGCAI